MSEQPPLYAEIDRLQAELAAAQKRVAELEHSRDLAMRVYLNMEEAKDKVEAERDKMAAALEWYADPANYLKSVPGHWGEWQDAEPDGNRRKWVQDHGQRARQTLGRE